MKYFLSLLVLIITACSPQNEQNANFETKVEALASFQDTSTALADFGNPVTTSTTRIFTFKNIGDSAGPGTPTLSGTNAASFSIVLQTGCATVNVGSTCTIRLNFNPSGKSIGTYNADLNVGGTIKSLSATVAAATTGGSTTGGTTSGSSGSIEATVSSAVIPNPLDYGSFSGTQTSTKIIRLKNTGTTSTGPHTAMLSDTDFSFTLNGCNNKTLAPNAYCDVRVTFSASGKTAQEYLTDLTFAGSTFPLKATVAASGGTTGGASGGPVVSLSILEGTNPAADPLNYGTFSGTQSLTKILTVKNTGTSSVVVNPTLSDASFKFVLNSCANKTLTPNGICSVRVSFSASGQTSGTKNSTLTVHASKTLALTAEVTGSSTIITYQLEYSNYGACSAINACDGVGSQTRTATCRQLNNGIPGGTVSLSNCPAPDALSQSCDSPSGTAVVTSGLATGYSSQTVSCLAGQTTASGTITDVSCDLHYNKQGLTCEIERFSITVNKTKAYGDVTSGPLGLNCANVSSCTAQFDYGTEVTLYPTVSSGNGYAFGGFSGTCNGTGTCVITVTANVTLDMILDCEPDFHEDGTLCVPDVLTYTADYSDYGLCSADEACEGQGIQSRTITQCNQLRNGNPDGTVDLSFCSAYDIPAFLDLSCDSPPGNKFVAISNGTKEVSCLSGSTIENFVGVSCDTLYHGEGELCLSDSRACTPEELTAVDVDATAGTANWNTGTLAYDCTIDTCSASTHLVSASNLCDPNTVSCSDTAGGYFGVANGTKTWNSTTQIYGYCIPTNSSSCIATSQTYADGTTFNYIYRSAAAGSLFPSGQEEYPDYPYNLGACVADVLSCTSSISNAKVAVRQSFGGENPYQDCEVYECNGGYQNSFSSCVVKKIYFSGSTSPGSSPNNIRSYNFETDTISQVSTTNSSTSSLFGPNLLTIDSDNLYYQAASGGNIYKVGLTSLTETPIGSSADFTGEAFSAISDTNSGRLFFNVNTFTNGREVHYVSIANTSAQAPSVSSAVSGTGHGGLAQAVLAKNQGGYIYNLGSSNSTVGNEIAYINPFSPATINLLNLESGTGASVDSTGLGSVNPVLTKGDYMYYVGTSAANGSEIYRIYTAVPASPSRTVWAEVAASSAGSSPSLLTEWNDRLFFKATSGTETELYYKAFSSTGAPIKIDLVAGSTGVTTLNDMVVLNNKLYLSLNINSTIGAELYQLEETSTGVFTLTLAQDINPAASTSSSPQKMVSTGESIYFLATAPTGLSFCKFDGTSLRNLTQEKGVIPVNPSFSGRRILVK